jgi:ferric-dicitrate binding protein FerR (iron transport regulator)
MTRQDAIELWLHHLDGGMLSHEEQTALLHAWEADPGLRALCEADIALDAALHSRPADAEADAAFITGMTTVLRTQADGGVFAARVASRIQRSARLRRRRRSRASWVWAVALAACLAFLVAGAWLLSPHPDLPSVDGADAPLAAGSQLQPDVNTILVWSDGTRAEIAAGSALEILPSAAGKSVALVSGRIAIEAAKQPTNRPMTVRTPETLATVIGTRFVLDCAAGATRLAVSDGTVRLGEGADPLMVAAGSRAQADSHGIRPVDAAVWSWSSGDPQPPTLQRGTLGRAPDGRACLVSGPHTSSVVAVMWAASPAGLFPYDPDSELVGDIWLDEHVAWAGAYAQDDGIWRRSPTGTADAHHGQCDLPPAKSGWHRFCIPLRDLAKVAAGPPLRPGDRITHLVFQAQFPDKAVIRLDRLELLPARR